MSNYDRNVVIPGAPVDQTFAVDAGLRAHMLRVYNYMATGVGLTGLVAMLTYQFTGPELLQSPLMWVFMLAPLALVFFISARRKSPTTRQRVQLRQQIAPDRAVLPASLAGRPSYQDLAAAVATESI
jgi:FtsH-binding integral membrane protein